MEDLSPRAFKSTESARIRCSEQNSNSSLSGTVAEFEVKDYCPSVFRHLQALDDINYGDYMLSICDHETLREICSLPKSGCLIFLSRDDRFTIKSLRKCEVKVLREMLPNYVCHVKQYRASLLAKLYGLHVVRSNGGAKVYFVVMENVLQSNLCIHRCYDLKGSSQGRTLTKAENHDRTIYKDVDLDFCFYLDPLIRHQLLAQIKYDCDFLEAVGVINYSFLLGVHLEAPCKGSLDTKNWKTSKRGPHDLLQEHINFELSLSHYCQKPERPDSKLGVEMPVHAIRMPRNGKEYMSSNGGAGAQEFNALLYFGIVDILQEYNMRKRLEHCYKSIQYGSKSISAVNPKAYSTRFQDFLYKIFQAEDSDL